MKKTIDKNFDAVQYMRDERKKLTEKLSMMTKKEIVDYFKSQCLKNTLRPRA